MAERDDKVWLPKSIVLGWITTIIISIAGAYITVWAQLAGLRIELEILKVKTEQLSKREDEHTVMFIKINNKLNDIHTTLPLKADKKFSE